MLDESGTGGKKTCGKCSWKTALALLPTYPSASERARKQTIPNVCFGAGLIIDELCDRTRITSQASHAPTFRGYAGSLYPVFKLAGSLEWIQTLQMYRRKRYGFGLQFCSKCLNQSSEPYFKKSWRVSFNTTCLMHQCMMIGVRNVVPVSHSVGLMLVKAAVCALNLWQRAINVVLIWDERFQNPSCLTIHRPQNGIGFCS